jgi:hypothetical protein
VLLRLDIERQIHESKTLLTVLEMIRTVKWRSVLCLDESRGTDRLYGDHKEVGIVCGSIENKGERTECVSEGRKSLRLVDLETSACGVKSHQPTNSDGWLGLDSRKDGGVGSQGIDDRAATQIPAFRFPTSSKHEAAPEPLHGFSVVPSRSLWAGLGKLLSN